MGGRAGKAAEDVRGEAVSENKATGWIGGTAEGNGRKGKTEWGGDNKILWRGAFTRPPNRDGNLHLKNIYVYIIETCFHILARKHHEIQGFLKMYILELK